MTDQVVLDHGSGGQMSHQLIQDVLLNAFKDPILARLDDGAIFDVKGTRLAFSTDTFVVDPLFFPGGDIGDLAVNGTVNDLAMCGAKPLFLSVGMIIEEGFPMADLKRILSSMAAAAQTAGVRIVTGDTKVVPKGAADKLFINTSGVGLVREGIEVGAHLAGEGDHIILSGTMGDHGMTVLTQRQGLSFEADIRSDSAALNGLVEAMLGICPGIHVLRDPTRGGVGTTLNEIARQSDIGICLYEAQLPIRNEVAAVCELLGFDPLYVANEGKLLAFVPHADSDGVLEAVRQHPLGREAAVIGEVTRAVPNGKVILQTRIGGQRIVDMLSGEQLPRIC